MSSLYLLLIVSFITAIDATNIGKSIILSDAAHTYGALCLDGSPGNYYFAAGEAHTKYVLFFQGGGWCWSEGSCWARSKGSFGSTINDPATYNLNNIGFLGDDPTISPLFYNWNKIYVRYCDGMSFAGDLSEPIINASNTSQVMYYRGHRILNAVFESLLSDYGLHNATDFVIGGGSAGGLAVFINTNYIAQKFFDLRQTKVVSIPDVGFFIEYNGYQGKTQWANKMKYIYQMQNVSAIIEPNCVQIHGKNAPECLFPQNIAKYSVVPTFILNSQYDSYQAGAILGTGASNVTLLNEYGRNFTNILIRNFLSQNTEKRNIFGAYIDGCYHHDAKEPIWWSALHIDGYTQAQAFMQFYTGLNQENNRVFWYQNVSYPCDDCCPNKTADFIYVTTSFW